MRRLLPTIAALAWLIPVAAGFLEAFIPTAGFAYAGDWKRGLVPNAVRLGALVVVFSRSDFLLADECDGDATCEAFSLVATAATIWAIVGAVQTAHEHNASVVQRRASLFVGPAPRGGVSVGIRLP